MRPHASNVEIEIAHFSNPLAQDSYIGHRRLTTGIRGLLFRLIPRPLRRWLRLVFDLLLDGRDLLLGRRRDMVPPRCLNFVGDGDFEATGDEFLRYFVELAGLKAGDRVLELGCGIGRMARPLTTYLEHGSYEGVDIVPRGIRWSQRNISNRYPNFRFRLADVYNRAYNPKGRFQPAEYQFPFAKNSFDFVLLTSVFTHMLTQDMEHYLAEIARALRPKGRCLITFFLLNEESSRLISVGQSSLRFRFCRDGCRIDDDTIEENAVAFPEAHIRALYGRLGFTLETIRYGAWCGRESYLSYQDIVVAQKN
jgi:ubiquinone/menaquinone biosynthesis C-methylase UbiE